jgi:hypothetical protein
MGRHWAVEVPILGVVTQGRNKSDALEMIADAVECLVNKPGFRISVFSGPGDHFEIGASDQAALTALLLRRERLKSGLTLAQAAERLGSKSPNAYARYEQGRASPTVPMLSRLFSAIAMGGDFVLVESQAQS